MIDNTINDNRTIADGGKDMILAGRYHILRQLGQGGMGSVWLAEDRQLNNRKVAIKMLPTVVVQDKRAYQQLKGEALVSLKLIHPNIVTLRAFEENDGAPFLVMDYIEGRTLSDYLAVRGKLSEAETIKLLKPIAAALDYAHSEKVIHRDIKPSNIIVRNDGHPFILDFGIAREIQESMTRVTGRTISGTLLYMSPEQLRGAPPAPAQDVYSFAAMCYECLSGNPPFTRGEIAYQILNEKPTPLVDAKKLAEPILAGLSKRPGSRPKSCLDILCEKSYSKRNIGYTRGSSLTKNVGRATNVPSRMMWGAICFLVLAVVLSCWSILLYDKKKNSEQFLAFFEAEKYDEAAELLDRVDYSIPQIQLSLGRMYLTGRGVKKNTIEAGRWYRKAANSGNVEAQCELACMYEHGNGVSKDEREAAKWYLKAAEWGYADAQSQMGKMYWEGEGVEQNHLEAVKWYRKAAEQGHAAAQCMLGAIYDTGEWVTKDEAEAVRWYRKAAAQGNALAQCQLGHCYKNGQGVAKDEFEAVKWFRKSANKGNLNAKCELSCAYMFGNGINKDEEEAIRLIRDAATQGYANAQGILGGFYMFGVGVAKNEQEAIYWLRKAARQGNEAAQETLRDAGLSW